MSNKDLTNIEHCACPRSCGLMQLAWSVTSVLCIMVSQRQSGNTKMQKWKGIESYYDTRLITGTWPLGSMDCKPNAIFPWFGVWGCWVGPEREIVAWACRLWEGAAICFSCAVFQWLRVSSGDCYLVLTFSSYCLIIATISSSFCAYTFSDANMAILATK